MRVQYQPSGGRGEYELSDNHGDLSAPDLLNLELYAGWGQFGLRRTGLSLQPETQGKFRLRISHAGAAHFQIQLAAGLLLPHPIREEGRLEGGPVLILAHNYLVNRVELTSVIKHANRADVEFGSIEINNRSLNDSLGFAARLERVVNVHSRIDRLPDELRALIDIHQQLLQANRPITRRDEGLVRAVMREVEDVASDYNVSYIPGTDPLPVLEQMVADPGSAAPDALDQVSIDSIPPDDLELRRRIANRVKRLVAVRGPKSVRFRRDVTNAYRFRCIVCGMRFPKSQHCSVPGVDAAHIIAWRDAELDETHNGVCLCKTHHWAFDQQLISILWNDENEEYQIVVTDRARKAFAKDAPTLESLTSLERSIPREWLPHKRTSWPHRQLLAKLLEDLPPVD